MKNLNNTFQNLERKPQFFIDVFNAKTLDLLVKDKSVEEIQENYSNISEYILQKCKEKNLDKVFVRSKIKDSNHKLIFHELMSITFVYQNELSEQF